MTIDFLLHLVAVGALLWLARLLEVRRRRELLMVALAQGWLDTCSLQNKQMAAVLRGDVAETTALRDRIAKRLAEITALMREGKS